MTFYEVITHILIPIRDAIARRWVLASVGGGIPLLRRMVLEEERKGEARITVLVREEDEHLKDILYGTVADMKILEATGQVGDMVRKLRDQGVEVREIPVCDETGRIQLENRLLTGLVKDTEGVMAKLVNRRVSLAVTRRLMNRNVTPNQMTWVSMAIGLLGAMFFLLPGQSAQVAGASLFLLHSILDGCDGELARLKFLESRTGGMLDYWTDNIVHVAVFACIGAGWAMHGGDSQAWLFSLLAVSGTLMSAWLVFDHTMRTKKENGPLYTSVSTESEKSILVRIVDVLSRRDFIYLVMTAAGAPLYAAILLTIITKERGKAA